MIVDGRAIAAEINADTKKRVEALGRVPSFLAISVAPNPATQSYLRMKCRQAEVLGISMEVRILDEKITTEEIIDVVQNAQSDAVIVQLPLPSSVDTSRVIAAIAPAKDADVLSPQTRLNNVLQHPIAMAIAEIFQRYNVNPKGMRVVVVGNGWLVGSPASSWLQQEGAEVTVVTREQGDLTNELKRAEVVVSGAGSPILIKSDDIAKGAIVIDIGTSELGGSLSGDVSPEVASVAGLYTPVPGGVGPITVACLFRNVVTLLERSLQEN